MSLLYFGARHLCKGCRQISDKNLFIFIRYFCLGGESPKINGSGRLNNQGSKQLLQTIIEFDEVGLRHLFYESVSKLKYVS